MTTTTDPVAAPSASAEPLTTHPRRLPRFRAVLAAFGLGIVIAVTASAAGLYAYDRVHADQVMPGVHVGTVDLSGLDRAAAAAKLREAYASASQGSVVLVDGVATDSIPFSDLGRAVAVDQLLDQAFAVGRTGAIVDRTVDQVRTATRGVTIAPQVTVDPDAVLKAVSALAARESVLPADASVTATPTGFVTNPGAAGRTIDQDSAVKSIVTALTDPATTGEVRIPLPSVAVDPEVTTDEADAARDHATSTAQNVLITSGAAKWTLPAATIRGWISFDGDGSDYAAAVDTSKLATVLKPFAKSVARPVKDATFLTSKSGAIIGVTASSVGQALDVNGTAAAVAAVLQARATGAPAPVSVQAAVKATQPNLSTTTAQKTAPLMRKISSWTTFYGVGPHNGFGANITIPALAISGTVVAPGQWFSFWNAVGDVSLAKGYKLGGAIVDGHSVEGKTIGGGICSTSTTLFNAALRAGFQTGSRKNHFYYISRYPKGLDATVYISDGGGEQDMTWKNNSPYPVLIKAYAVPGIVRFTLYSVPNGRKVSISPAVVKNYSPSTTIRETTTSLKPGHTEQTEYEAAGFDSWVTVTVRDKSGKIISKKTYFSHYARVVGVILVGAKRA
jgi:vancomycin resistance protein YoaR